LADWNDLRAAALALPGARETEQMGERAFKVGRKGFMHAQAGSGCRGASCPGRATPQAHLRDNRGVRRAGAKFAEPFCVLCADLGDLCGYPLSGWRPRNRFLPGSRLSSG
jgi:hypothetical protein